MGLDLIELVLDVEKSFDISLEDDEVAQIVTVGQFCDLVVGKTSGVKLPDCPAAKAFYRLRQCLILVLGFARKDVRPSTTTLALVPFWRRRRIWKRLERELGLKMPLLVNQAGIQLFENFTGANFPLRVFIDLCISTLD